MGRKTVLGTVGNTPLAQHVHGNLSKTFPIGAQALPPSFEARLAYLPLTSHLPILRTHLVKILACGQLMVMPLKGAREVVVPGPPSS